MTIKPIIFSAPMIRALQREIEAPGTGKTQTRRIVKQPRCGSGMYWNEHHKMLVNCMNGQEIKAPYSPGDLLWVREAHSLHNAHGTDRDDGKRWGPWGGLPTAVSPDGERIAYYREGFDRCGFSNWRPSIHMPRWASRLTLRVTDMRVERLQDIHERNAIAEGAPVVGTCRITGAPMCKTDHPASHVTPCLWFHRLWDSLHGTDAWDKNPWVWAVTLQPIAGNVDQIKEAS